MDVVKVSWSGGKDSTASVILHHLAGHKCKICNYIPMLDKDLPLILPQHYEFIMSTADLFRSWGHDVYITHGIYYYDHVRALITRGKHKGLPRGSGLGIFGFCNFRNYSKIRGGLDTIDCGAYDYQDIGIAADEISRQRQLSSSMRSILCEKGYTERDASILCQEYGLISPHYFCGNGRDGCVICPNAKPREFLLWLRSYPAAVSSILDIENYCKSVRPDLPPYRDYKWWSDRMQEDFQYSFF